MSTRIFSHVILFCLYLLFAGIPVSAEDRYFEHVVKIGESISLICIDYYGYYDNALGEIIRDLNPGVKNINLIFSGDFVPIVAENRKEKDRLHAQGKDID